MSKTVYVPLILHLHMGNIVTETLYNSYTRKADAIEALLETLFDKDYLSYDEWKIHAADLEEIQGECENFPCDFDEKIWAARIIQIDNIMLT